ncbi:MAG: hypothetical protein H7A25_08680 [Leptospiraceae bacterium]|nr:hypothetical protein [Leptospiraceae bacterium]
MRNYLKINNPSITSPSTLAILNPGFACLKTLPLSRPVSLPMGRSTGLNRINLQPNLLWIKASLHFLLPTSFDEEINYETELSTLNLTFLKEQFQAVNKKLSNEKLQNLKLIKKEQKKIYPTNALLLLTGTFSHCKVKCARFKGTNMDTFIDKKEYSGDIFSVYENTLNFILNHIHLRGDINGMRREESYEVPVVALREALTNAFVHRDYINQGRDIKVGIFDDIINIVSPGGLPNTITIQDLENGRSESRNKVIARVFKELGLIEEWGTGIKRMKNACLSAGIKPPTIEEKGDFIDVTFYRNLENKKTNSGSDRLRPITTDYDRLNEEEKELLLFIQKEVKITRKKAKEKFEYGETKLKSLFNTLLEKGLIERKGKGRNTYYIMRGNIRIEE